MARQQAQPQYENRSRLGLATPAIRPGMKGRMLLAGPSGSGKTYTSLLIAMSLRTNIEVASVLQIDTEKDSGRTYADEFLLGDGSPAYKHISWAAPYNAVDLAMTLRDASGQYDVVIVDSHSHFWRGQGGVLDVAGGRWTGWGEARPMHADMVDAILSCDCHVILCARSTMEHVQEKNEATGKIEVRKLGMKIQQDADLEYEMNVGLELDMNHVLRVTKSRTRAVPVGKEFIAGHAEEFAGVYRDWLKGGEPAATKEQVDNLIAVLNRIDDPPTRQEAKRQFVEVFGRPEMLLVSRLDEANEWVADKLLGNEPTPDRAEDDEPGESGQDGAQDVPDAVAVDGGGDGAQDLSGPHSGSDGGPGPEVDPLSQPTALLGPWVAALTATRLDEVLTDCGIVATGNPGHKRGQLLAYYEPLVEQAGGDVARLLGSDVRSCATCGGYKTNTPPWGVACSCPI